MRHLVDGKKLGRTSSHKKAMFANMATSLIMCERIETTLPKAKELRRIAERLITLGKQQTLHSRRRALSMIQSKEAVSKLFSDVAKRFTDRNGGYTRIMKLGFRHGDSAPMAMIEYVVTKIDQDSDSSKKSKKKAAPKVEKKKEAKKPDDAEHAKKAKTEEKVEKKAKERAPAKKKATKAKKSDKE